ncbi:MAG: hypothetical protein WDM89_12135 [Rhizomicrobium sp.]
MPEATPLCDLVIDDGRKPHEYYDQKCVTDDCKDFLSALCTLRRVGVFVVPLQVRPLNAVARLIGQAHTFHLMIGARLHEFLFAPRKRGLGGREILAQAGNVFRIAAIGAAFRPVPWPL